MRLIMCKGVYGLLLMQLGCNDNTDQEQHGMTWSNGETNTQLRESERQKISYSAASTGDPGRV